MTDTAIDEAPPPARRNLARPIVAIVVVALLALGLWLAYRPAPGQIQGMVDAREMRITSKVTARIAAFHVEEGQQVKAGQLLYTLDSPEVAAKTEQAGGALAAAQAVESKARGYPRRRGAMAPRAGRRRSRHHHRRAHRPAVQARRDRRAEGR